MLSYLNYMLSNYMLTSQGDLEWQWHQVQTWQPGMSVSEPGPRAPPGGRDATKDAASPK
jgi:hypothetical protein